MKFTLAIAAILVLASMSAALAQGCCGGKSSAQAGCPMARTSATEDHKCQTGAQAAAANYAPSNSPKVFTEPVQLVYNSYITVQATLAQDSLKGISAAATAMTKAVQDDSTKLLSPKVAEQAQALANAKDLGAARDAFRSLSDLLISYLKEQKIPPGAYYVAYCPMAKASWLQTSKTILNPYMGMSMVHCGQIKP